MNPSDRARLVGLARRNWPALLSVLAALAGVTIVVTHDGGGPGGRTTITVHVDGADPDTKPDDALPLSSAAQKVQEAAQAAPERLDVSPMRGPDSTPAGVIRGPLASQEWPGCKTAFVRSFSQRTSSIRAIALHYTAGANVVGWADLDGLTAFSNNARNQVSWHFGIDREGHCAYNVPIQQKAWTISGLNSQTVNLEIVGTGKEPDYAGAAGVGRVRAVVRRIAALEHIPLRLGATDGHCNVTRTGIITHWMGGPCSGGHVDIRPYDVAKVVAAIATNPCSARCRRARDLRRRHGAVHEALRACGGSRSAPCRELRRRNTVLHRVARREGVRL